MVKKYTIIFNHKWLNIIVYFPIFSLIRNISFCLGQRFHPNFLENAKKEMRSSILGDYKKFKMLQKTYMDIGGMEGPPGPIVLLGGGLIPP